GPVPQAQGATGTHHCGMKITPCLDSRLGCAGTPGGEHDETSPLIIQLRHFTRPRLDIRWRYLFDDFGIRIALPQVTQVIRTVPQGPTADATTHARGAIRPRALLLFFSHSGIVVSI